MLWKLLIKHWIAANVLDSLDFGSICRNVAQIYSIDVKGIIENVDLTYILLSTAYPVNSSYTGIGGYEKEISQTTTFSESRQKRKKEKTTRVMGALCHWVRTYHSQSTLLFMTQLHKNRPVKTRQDKQQNQK